MTMNGKTKEKLNECGEFKSVSKLSLKKASQLL